MKKHNSASNLHKFLINNNENSSMMESERNGPLTPVMNPIKSNQK